MDKITQAIEPSLEAMGYRLVQVKLSDQARRKTLTIMAERKDDQNMSFDDCTEISRTVGALLDVEDPISSAYDLEVCSPGVDRPLVKPDDFIRHLGYEIRLETQLPANIEGRRRFRGKLVKASEKQITITMPEGDEVEIAFNNIRGAKLVMTDELIAAQLKKQKAKAN